MSGYDPNNPNNPWGNQGWNGQQGNQQGGQQPAQQPAQQQTWDQQQQQQQQQQWGQQPGQQQGQWDAQQQQQQQQWDQQQQWNAQQQAQGQQQWDPQQQQWNQQQQQWGQPQAQAQSWDQQQQWNQGQPQQAQSWEQQQSQWSGVAGVSGGAAVADPAADVAESGGRSIGGAVATLGSAVRVTFIKKTYAHLAAAIGVFTGLLFLFFKVPVLTEKFVQPFTNWAVATQQNWIVVMVAFMAAGWVGEKWAKSATSRGWQYMGLLFYTVAEAVIFVPLIRICQMLIPDSGALLAQAAVITTGLFVGLTAIVLITRKDFSFLKGALALGCMISLGTIIAAYMFGFSLGIFFSVGMCALAGGYMLYYTSRVLAHYHPDAYVAAALHLFSAFTLMLWYVIRILMSLRR